MIIFAYMKNYHYTSAKAFFKELESICHDAADIHEKYATLRNVFRIAVEQKLVDNRLAFTGLFAKVDYLIKEYAIPFDMAQRVNTTRKVLFPARMDKAVYTDQELELSFHHDLKAVCQFVSAVGENEKIPSSLTRLFPHTDRDNVWRKFDERQERVVVDRWDDNYIYARCDADGSELKVCYGKKNRYLIRGDWSYLNELLRKDGILNLVRIRIEDGICCPELIICEPDYLVDVSTIASCIETYTDSPLVHLLSRIKPYTPTAPMLMGNLAGQFLDEAVKGDTKSYAQSVGEYFHKNALNMVVADIPTTFHHEAQCQRKNIERLIGEDLPKEVDGYKREKVVLEPSFFCETLGLQGRMDFMQKGGGVIIEQKSGKAAFVPFTSPSYNPDVPVPQEKHYAQLLLYRALMQYGFNMRSDKLHNIFLLYSKYTKGLLRLGAAPDILFKAIKLRNGIAAQEISLAYDGFDVLTSLTADAINEKGISGKLWLQYVKPEIESVLQPLRDATPTERAYCLRFLRFIAMEHLLSKIGNKTKENSGFASKWLDSLEEKKATGNIYDNLRIGVVKRREDTFSGYKEDAVESVSLIFDKDDVSEMSNFRVGDIVILYPYAVGNVPDACGQMVFRAAIEDINDKGITLRLRNSQTGDSHFNKSDNVRWAVEHDFFESSFSSLYRGVYSFLSAPLHRRKLILSQRKPETDSSVTLKGDYGYFNELVFRAKQAKDYFLIIGPPGTGKTSFGLLNIVLEELRENSHILLMSYTNRAVDEICGKLKHAGIEYIRIGSELSCSPEYRDNLLERKTATCRNVNEVESLIKETRVFCGTTSSMNASMPLLSIKAFDIAVIDEASQILEPHLIGLLGAKSGNREAIKKFVLIGDHKQLPAVVQQTADESKVEEPELQAINLTNCRLSLFERLLNACGENPKTVYMLTRQGRMHRGIAVFPNLQFYNNCLDIVPCPHQDITLPTYSNSGNGIVDLLTTRRVAFLASPLPKHSPSDKVNIPEAEMIAATVTQAYNMHKDTFGAERTIGVIVPYRNQIATVRDAIARYGIDELRDITIDTVERYQGSQRDIIIYGFTVQKLYQLNFLASNTFEDNGVMVDRKLNVAMTRARKHLIIVGNPQVLYSNAVFKALMDYTQSIGSFFEVSPEEYCEGRFTLPSQSKSC